MLVNAGVRNGGGPGRFYGGVTAASMERGKWAQPGNLRNIYAGEATVISGSSIADKSGYPNGYRHPGSWSMAPKPGGMSSYSGLQGSGSVTAANLAGGLNAEATLTGTGTITAANLALIVSAVATLTGTGSLSADITGIAPMSATLSGSGSLAANLQALGNLVATMTGTGTLTASARATGSMSATITPFAELSPQSLAAEVWNSVASAFNNPGSMGAQANFLYVLAHHKVVTNPATGVMTIYDTDDTTVLWTANLFEDAAGSAPYDGGGAERREKFE